MTGRELSEQLQVSEATVSRLASGERRPSVELMRKIQRVLRWSLVSQLQALETGSYADEFKRRMQQRRAQPKRSLAA